MFSKIKFLAAVFSLVLCAQPAEARRTVIDRSDPLNPLPDITVSGYCDLDGADCSALSLGYTVDFGQGPLGEVIVYGNGLLSFGPDAVGFGDLDSPFTSLASYAGYVVSPGLNNNTVRQDPDDFDSLEVFTLVGSVSVDAITGTITALFLNCFSSSNCLTSNSSLVLTPGLGGYNVTSTNSSTGLAGYAFPDGTVQEQQIQGATTFFIPATFQGLNINSAVPEPATWAMMLIGFGAIGFSMRRKPKNLGVAA